MTTLLEFTVPADAFPLGSVFTTLPGATIELERIVPTNGAVFPYLWIRGIDRADVERTLQSTSNGDSLSLVDDLEDSGLLYRAALAPATDRLLDAITRSDVTLLSAIGKRGRWTFRVRAGDHAEISAFRDRCHQRGIDLNVVRLQPFGVPEAATDLTAAQLEALELAFDRGYFDEPRRVTLDELAADLGITRQSLAGRLRRGHRTLLSQLFTNPDRQVTELV